MIGIISCFKFPLVLLCFIGHLFYKTFSMSQTTNWTGFFEFVIMGKKTQSSWKGDSL